MTASIFFMANTPYDLYACVFLCLPDEFVRPDGLALRVFGLSVGVSLSNDYCVRSPSHCFRLTLSRSTSKWRKKAPPAHQESVKIARRQRSRAFQIPQRPQVQGRRESDIMLAGAAVRRR